VENAASDSDIAGVENAPIKNIAKTHKSLLKHEIKLFKYDVYTVCNCIKNKR